MPEKMDQIVSEEDGGRFTRHITGGGDEYVVDHSDHTCSGVLSSEEEKMLDSGELVLSDIICDDDNERNWHCPLCR